MIRTFFAYTFYFFIVSNLCSCSSGVELLPVNKGALLHDLNSKVWMLDKVLINDSNVAPKINFDKDILVFYRSGKCLLQPMRSIGDVNGKRGEFSLYSEDKALTLYFQGEKWDFNMNVITEDTLFLIPRKKSDFKYSLVLVPFPEI
ncbi:MAG: hypothetical protein LW688_09725 [Cryomorphaceae bacterium]|nr:hypothetical protein [Cryomorphaceae bacterium]